MASTAVSVFVALSKVSWTIKRASIWSRKTPSGHRKCRDKSRNLTEIDRVTVYILSRNVRKTYMEVSGEVQYFFLQSSIPRLARILQLAVRRASKKMMLSLSCSRKNGCIAAMPKATCIFCWSPSTDSNVYGDASTQYIGPWKRGFLD